MADPLCQDNGSARGRHDEGRASPELSKPSTTILVAIPRGAGTTVGAARERVAENVGDRQPVIVRESMANRHAKPRRADARGTSLDRGDEHHPCSQG
jgi:hypothetical protein